MNINKIKFLIFLFFILSLGASGQTATKSAIRINVTNINSSKGTILAALYNSEKGFPGEGETALLFVKGIPANGKCQIVIENITPGIYAVALFHDVNGDKKLNTNWFGIPKEGYGFSNDASNFLSAPTFKQAAFAHKNETTIAIKMKY
jgi:uncharacterized protein (DUF2141 family)